MEIYKSCLDCEYYFESACVWAMTEAPKQGSLIMTMGNISPPKGGLIEKLKVIDDQITELNKIKPTWFPEIIRDKEIMDVEKSISRNHPYIDCPAYLKNK